MPLPAVHCIIKIGSSEHLERLRTEGEVYMNTWGFFKRFEENNVQGDRDEGLLGIEQVANGVELRVKINERFEPIKGLFGQVKFESPDLELYNLFCMFAVTDENYRYLDDPRLLKFGDTSVIMTSGDEFLSRTKKQLVAEGIEHGIGLVNYVSQATHHGKMGPLRKFLPYSYQSELRILAHAKRGGPYSVKIGDIRGISHICPTSELKSRLRLVYE